MIPTLKINCLLAFLVPWATLHAQDIPKKLPKEDVVQVPAIGQRLCVGNAFQSNMVLQRDKLIVIRGWADPGEDVTIDFAGRSTKATAGADRAWQARLAALPATRKPWIASWSRCLTPVH